MTKPGTLFAAATPVLTAENYRFLQNQVYQHSGIVLDDSKHYLLESRLLPIVRSEGLSDLNALCVALMQQGRSPLCNRVVEAMTTNETLFFRDLAPFDALKNQVLPEVLASAGSRPIRIWSAAASTGQEAYSIAMVLSGLSLQRDRAQILGTDLSEEVLEKARAGIYSQLEVNRGLPAQNLVKHFTRKGMSWEVSEALRSMVTFRQLDLRSGIRALGTFDVVFCRNVLIYFDLDTKRAILREIYNTITMGGYLFLGAAETTLNVEERLVRKVHSGAVVYQKLEAV